MITIHLISIIVAIATAAIYLAVTYRDTYIDGFDFILAALYFVIAIGATELAIYLFHHINVVI